MGSTVLDLREVRDDFDYLIMDDRYCTFEEEDESTELRLAISWGINLTARMNHDILRMRHVENPQFHSRLSDLGL